MKSFTGLLTISVFILFAVLTSIADESVEFDFSVPITAKFDNEAQRPPRLKTVCGKIKTPPVDNSTGGVFYGPLPSVCLVPTSLLR